MLFPWSSPFAMIARAAQSPDLWPHLAIIPWQALWVGLTVRLGVSLFRRNVMKSGAGEGRKGLPLLRRLTGAAWRVRTYPLLWRDVWKKNVSHAPQLHRLSR